MNYKSKKVMLLIILVLLIIIPAGIFINKNLSKGDLDSNAVKWTQEKNSDPESIKIPGYSKYLHPIGENYLIGFGEDSIEKS